MKTDPPIPPDVPQPPRPERPRGKVFDVMRPGQAPASPTSRPVISSHKPQAQNTQVTVSGIGAPEPRDNLGSHKMALKPMHNIDISESTPKVGAPHSVAGPAPAQGLTPPDAAASEAPAAENATLDSLPELQADETARAAASVPEVPVPAAADVPETPAAPEVVPDVRDAGASKPDPLEDVAMEPDTPAPAAAEPELPKLPIPEVPDDDPVHDSAEPSLKGQVVVSHHSAISEGSGKLVFLIILALVFLLIVVDILLDVGIIPLSGVPHTNFF
jgi:hypothetical protein